MSGKSDDPKNKVRTLGLAYPVPVMLEDIANSDNGPYQSGVFVGRDKDGSIRFFVSAPLFSEAVYLAAALNAFIQNEFNKEGYGP